MSEPSAVTDKAIDAGEKAFRKLALEVPCREDRDFAVAVLEAATPWLAFTAGGLAADLLREKDERITDLEQLAAEILATFTRTEGGHRARAGQLQIQKWHARLNPAEPWNPGGHAHG